MATDALTTAPNTSSEWVRAFWRWHFYASFLVIPVFAMLALTGLIYLFRFQIEPMLHADVMRVDAGSAAIGVAPSLAPQLELVQTKFPNDTVALIREGREANDPNVFSLERPDGSTLDVFVDPWQTKILGSLDPETTLSGTALRLHAELMSGRWGDGIIEAAASWGIVMALTGYYLFVAGRSARLKRQAKRAVGALVAKWHATIGVVAGIGLLFMVFTGLPWTAFWGETTQALATKQGTSFWSMDPGAKSATALTLDEAVPHHHASEVPWAQGASVVPTSGTEGTPDTDIDAAAVVAEKQGLQHPFSIVPPTDSEGVYSVMGDAFHDPSRERTVHVDQYSGSVRADYSFADYPLLAKTISQGIGLHEGRSLGIVSMVMSAAFCMAVLALCVTGPLMWWRRRPAKSGSIGAPRGRMPIRATRWLATGLLALGLFLPLFGLTLIAVLVLDQVVLRRVQVLKAAFDTID